MLIAGPAEQWQIFHGMSAQSVVRTLQELATKVNLVRFK
jgi:hypothetical protein